jgi:hypothetical protein
MPQNRYNHEEIINNIRSAEVEFSSRIKVEEAWRFEELEAENARLKKLVVDLSLDKEILKEAVSKNF